MDAHIEPVHGCPLSCGRPGVGPSCEYLVGELLADNALYRLRAAQGVIGLADKHDPGRLEAACAKAVAVGDGGASAFLRGPASFANVIPMPGTIPSDALTPATTEGAPS